MSFKNFRIFFVCFCFLIFLSGCTKQSGATIIKFASWGSKSEVDIIKPIIKEYENKNPNVKIDFIHIPQNYFQKIHLLFASNTAPDVIFINNLNLPIYANANVLEELSVPEGFYPQAIKALSYKGKLYAIPRDVSNLVIFYNKDLFDRLNVPYPKENWTFNDFLTTSQKLTKKGLFGISFEEDIMFYLPYLMSEGGGVLSDDLSELIIEKSESKKGLSFYADLRKKYHVAPLKYESASATMAQLFLQEKIAMHLTGRWLVPKYRTDAKFDWDIINFPHGSVGSVVPLDASGWAVSKYSKHKNEAKKFIDFLASKECCEKFTKSGLIVPARIDVSESEIFLDGKKPKNAKVFIETIKTSKPTPVSVNYNEISNDIKRYTEKIFN